MVSATTTKPPRILIGRSGSELPFTLLAEGIRNQGYPVTEQQSSPVGAHSTGRAAQDVLNNVDMAFLVVRERDAADLGGPVKPFQRILREAGVMQGKMGMDKVVLLVEETVDGLSADTGVSYIRFPPDQPDSVLTEVLNKIGTTFPKKERDLHERLPIIDQARSDDLRVPWLLVGLVVLAAMIPLIVALSALAGSDDSDDAEEVVAIEGVTAGLSRGAAAAAAGVDPSTGTGQESSTEARAEQTTEGEQATRQQVIPAGPGVAPGGSNEFLPATCELDVRKGSLLDDAVTCRGAGQVVLGGRDGPWHGEIGAVALSDGVAGELEYELGGLAAGQSAVVELVPGTTVLDPQAASFGVQHITVRFSADDQHVHLFQNPEDGNGSATLTYTLER